MTKTSPHSNELSTLITLIKSQYLDSRKVGVRAFATSTGIRRSRLNKLFEGKAIATIGELNSINQAMNDIEARYELINERNKKKELAEQEQSQSLSKIIDDALGLKRVSDLHGLVTSSLLEKIADDHNLGSDKTEILPYNENVVTENVVPCVNTDHNVDLDMTTLSEEYTTGVHAIADVMELNLGISGLSNIE